MILWELILIILMMVVFNFEKNLDRLMKNAISKISHPIWIAMEKYFRYFIKNVALLKHLLMEKLKLNVQRALNKSLRVLNGLCMGLLKFCWLIFVLLASVLYKQLIFTSKLFKILQSVKKRPQFCVIR